MAVGGGGDPLAEGIIEVSADLTPLEDALADAQQKVEQSVAQIEQKAQINVTTTGAGAGGGPSTADFGGKDITSEFIENLNKDVNSSAQTFDRWTKTVDDLEKQTAKTTPVIAAQSLVTQQQTAILISQEQALGRIVQALEKQTLALSYVMSAESHRAMQSSEAYARLQSETVAIAANTAAKEANAKATATQTAAETAASPPLSGKLGLLGRLHGGWLKVGGGLRAFGVGLKGLVAPIRIASSAILGIVGTIGMLTGVIGLLIGGITFIINKFKEKKEAIDAAKKSMVELAEERKKIMETPLVEKEPVDKELKAIQDNAAEKSKLLKENYEAQRKNLISLQDLGDEAGAENKRQQLYEQYLKDQAALKTEEADAKRDLRKRRAAKKEEDTLKRLNDLGEELDRDAISLTEDETLRAERRLRKEIDTLDEQIAREEDKRVIALLERKKDNAYLQFDRTMKQIEEEKKVRQEAIDEEARNKEKARKAEERSFRLSQRALTAELKRSINAVLDLSSVEASVNKIGGLIEMMVNKMRRAD
jgi:hypothetical protein